MNTTPDRISIVSAAAMRERDRLTVETFGLPGMVLMERAALACSDLILSRTPASAPVCILAGPGNNGGDGLAIARHLHGAGRDVAVVLAADPARLVGDTASQLRLLQALDILLLVVEPGEDDFMSVLQAPVWVDALLGTGSTGAPRGVVAQVLESAAALYGSRVLAIVLTGMGCDGVEGCRAVREQGGRVIAQAAEGCVVFGMPKAVITAGLADEVVPLEQVAATVIGHLR